MVKKYTDVTIVIPAYNEENSIQHTIKEIRRCLKGGRILVVDDGSKDKTLLLSKREKVDVISHRVNRGYMAALKTGMLNSHTPYVGFLDADMTYHPSYFVPMLEALKENHLGCVWGNRFGGKKNEMPAIRKIGNRILNIVFFVVTGKYVKDCSCGQRVLSKNAIKKLDVGTLPDGLDGITSLSKRIVTRRIPFQVIPMDYGMREGSSKLSIFKHFILMMRNILRDR